MLRTFSAIYLSTEASVYIWTTPYRTRALKAGHQNANANVKHDNSSTASNYDSNRHYRNDGSHCTDRKRTRVYTRVRSEPINSKSAEQTKAESGDSYVDSIERACEGPAKHVRDSEARCVYTTYSRVNQYPEF